MKKVSIFLLAIILFLSFSMQSEAKLKDNPRKGYEVIVSYTLKGDYMNYYASPNGKVMGKMEKITSPKGGGYQNSSMKVLKAVNSKWLKVKIDAVPYKYSKKYKGANKYKRVFYVKMSEISLTTEGGAIGSFVAKGNPTLLEMKKSNNSKTLKKIPVGTFFDYEHIIFHEEVSRQKWVHVKYVVKGKVYKGYVSTKQAQVYYNY